MGLRHRPCPRCGAPSFLGARHRSSMQAAQSFPCYCCQARLSPDLPDLCFDPPASVFSLQPVDSSRPSTAPRRTIPHAYSRAPATTQSGPTTAHPPIHQLPTHLSFLPLFSHILTSTLPDNNNSTPRPHTPGTVNAVRPPPLSLSLALVEVEAAGPSPVPHPPSSVPPIVHHLPIPPRPTLATIIPSLLDHPKLASASS